MAIKLSEVQKHALLTISMPYRNHRTGIHPKHEFNTRTLDALHSRGLLEYVYGKGYERGGVRLTSQGRLALRDFVKKK